MLLHTKKKISSPMKSFLLFLKLQKLKIKGDYRSRFPFRLETSKFILKTADTIQEIESLLYLRHLVFYKENNRKFLPKFIDIDEFDFNCEHLVIIDKKTNSIVGTYRFISSLFSEKFFSNTLFSIEPLLNLPGNKLELGRACIHPEFRTGVVIHLLWQGIFYFIYQTKARYLFGCTSTYALQPEKIAASFNYLKKNNHFSETYQIRPQGKSSINQYGLNFEHLLDDTEGSAQDVPKLLISYLKAGAKAFPHPGYDPQLKCLDFFMFLDTEQMSPSFQNRYAHSRQVQRANPAEEV